MTTRGEENILILKLDEFIRKYYRSRVIRGTIYSSAILLGVFITFILAEYAIEFGTAARACLFFGFISLAVYVLIAYIIVPLLKMQRIGGIISYDQAAEIVGKHFASVQDKLLNALQLWNNRSAGGSDELLLAGIRQKTAELSPVPFVAAIDLRENRRYLRFVIPPLLVLAAIFVIRPQIISSSTSRIVNYKIYFEHQMPFSLDVQNPSLEVMQTSDFQLEVNVSGEQIPDEIFVLLNNIPYKMQKKNKLSFNYTFSNLQQDLSFQLSAGGFTSREYLLHVLPKPSLLRFGLRLEFPAYINRQPEVSENTGDLEIPQGARVTWQFDASNTKRLLVQFSDTTLEAAKVSANSFSLARRFVRGGSYSIKTGNEFIPVAPDSVSYGIHVIPDQYPVIETDETNDSVNLKQIYYSGKIRDDYGFSSLTFNWKKFSLDSNGRSIESQSLTSLPLQHKSISQPFFYFLDLSGYELGPGDRLEYYFEVRDNDGINGPKSSRTRLMEFKAPTRDEIAGQAGKKNEEIRKEMEDAIKKSKQLQKDISDLSKNLNEKKQAGYEEKKKLEELLKKQQELQNKIAHIKQENEQNNKLQNEFSKTDESLMEKQQELEKLFDNVMTPEMKKLFDELNQMLDKLDKNMVQEKLDEMKLSTKDVEKELDRNLEMFRQLEVAEKLQNAVDKLEDLARKEKELSKETEKDQKDKGGGENREDKDKVKDKVEDKAKDKVEDKAKDKVEDKVKEDKVKEDKVKDKVKDKVEDKVKPAGNADKNEEGKKTEKKDAAQLLKEQEQISKEFEALKKDLRELEEKNKNLEEPNKIGDTKDHEQKIGDEMKKSSDQLGKNDRKNASQSQQKAAKEMEQMKEDLEESMMEAESQQQEENAETLRQILENLLNLSFAQEELMNNLEKTRVDNPKYTEIPKTQNKLKDDSKIIEDSLLALSKRAPQISALVNREINSIHSNMEKTVRHLADRNPDQSRMRMQFVMKSVNDLATLLNEALEGMQKQMKQQMQAKSKGGKCKKPGKGSGKNPTDGGNQVMTMKQMQEKLNQQLKDLKDALDKGQKAGEKPGEKPGKKPGGMGQQQGGKGMNFPGSSEQFAKLAAQQKALRLQMEQMMDKLKNKGKNPGGDMAN
jgi:hypothetical protein